MKLFVIVTGILTAPFLTAQTIPTNAKNACPLPAATFNSWFVTGTPTLNGVVNPADSTQVLSPNCGFYA